MIHLLCGPSASGKSTYAKEIVKNRHAVYFALDERLQTLSFPDSYNFGFVVGVLLPHAKACTEQILKESRPFLDQNREVILDIGSFRRVDRDFIRAWATEVNSPVTLYYFSSNKGTRHGRLLKRNAEKGATYSFHVHQWLFDLVEEVFEPPDEDEGAIIVP